MFTDGHFILEEMLYRFHIMYIKYMIPVSHDVLDLSSCKIDEAVKYVNKGFETSHELTEIKQKS